MRPETSLPGNFATTETAPEFHRRYKAWAESDPVARRLERKRLRARKNRIRRGLSSWRRDYWMRAQTGMERALMRKFHAIPNHCVP